MISYHQTDIVCRSSGANHLADMRFLPIGALKLLLWALLMFCAEGQTIPGTNVGGLPDDLNLRARNDDNSRHQPFMKDATSASKRFIYMTQVQTAEEGKAWIDKLESDDSDALALVWGKGEDQKEGFDWGGKMFHYGKSTVFAYVSMRVFGNMLQQNYYCMPNCAHHGD